MGAPRSRRAPLIDRMNRGACGRCQRTHRSTVALERCMTNGSALSTTPRCNGCGRRHRVAAQREKCMAGIPPSISISEIDTLPVPKRNDPPARVYRPVQAQFEPGRMPVEASVRRLLGGTC